MQAFIPLRYHLYYIGGSSNGVTDSSSSNSSSRISSSSSSRSSSSSSSSVHGCGWSAPPPLKAYFPHLYYPLSTKLLILLHLRTFPKLVVFSYKRPFKPLDTLANKVTIDVII